jgi:TonB-dependent SusC/RagA subfamily outer membrane receptor
MSSIQKRLFRLSVLLVLLCSVTILSAQSYKTLNHRIDSLIGIGLPKSALNEADKLDQLAHKEKNVPMQIKAVIYRMTFQSYIEENAQVAIINRLKLDIEKATFPVKPVLQSILANMFNQYYRQHRYEYSQRSRLEKPSEDFTQWDLVTLINETCNLFKASLSAAKREQMTTVDVLDGVLTGDKTTRHLRPTLYDFLLHQALDYFLTDEPTLIKPKLAFSINDPRLFSDSHTFANLAIPTTDTASTYYMGLFYLQQATLFHIQKHDDEALAALDLKRIEFLHNKVSLIDKDSRYTTVLKQIATTFAAKPISTDALMALAKYEKLKNNLKEALVYAHKAVATFPESMGGQNADVLIKEITHKTLSVRIENRNIPGEPILAQILYRNLKQVNYKIYPLTESLYKLYAKDEKNNSYQTRSEDSKTIPSFLKQLKPIRKVDLQLPDPQDYANHSADFKINALNPGNYLIQTEETQPADSSLIHIVFFKVSRMSYITRTYPNGNTEIRVMDRKSGEPLNDVTVNLNIQARVNNPAMFKTGLTDLQGMFRPALPTPQPYSFFDIQLINNGDTLTDLSKNIYGYPDRPANDIPVERTILFTDRQIYRPGQTIYFKGLQMEVTKGKSNIVTEKDVTVDFIDANNKTLSSLYLKSNEFGSFNGLFTIPQNILNGRVLIRTKTGLIAVNVEEYKRNSFSVAFLPVKGSYKINDSVKVNGLVKAYSGYGLSQARIIYHITRAQTRIPNLKGTHNPRYIPLETTSFKTDTLKTDDQGAFRITFKATPEADSIFNDFFYDYTLTIDVTDGAGETHSATTSVVVANNNIALQLNIPDEYKTSDTIKIAAAINNLGGQPQNGSIRVQVFSLQSQSNLVKERLWPVSDQHLMDKTEFKQAFPYYAYKNEDDSKTWPVVSQVTDTTILVNDSTLSFFNPAALKKLMSGQYRVVIHATNEKGDTTSVTKVFNLLADHPKAASLTRWVIPVKNVVRAGTETEFLVGSDEPVNVLVEKYKGNRVSSSRWYNLEAGLQTIKIPIAAMDSNINVQFMMVKQNRVYTSYQSIGIITEDNKLDIRTITFRNKLQPGEKEQWKLRVSGANNQIAVAEMVAGLYDASLDDFAPSQDWEHRLNSAQYNSYRRNYYSWNTNEYIRMNNSFPLKQRYYQFLYREYEYEQIEMLKNNFNFGSNSNFYRYRSNLDARIREALADKKMEEDYLKNASLVKNGVDVTGTVIDSKDESALQGVTINIKGTKIFAISNSKGKFKISVPLNGTLVFKYIGFNARELVIKKAQTITVPLITNDALLDEVVVVGYGRQRKDVVAPGDQRVEYMKSQDQLSEARQGISIADIRGTSEGTDITDTRITLRGNSSLLASNVPLIVVDGVIVEKSALDKIDINDIENVSILKGAEAVALYGEKAANGVMVVTTKSGGRQQPIQTRKNFNETAFFYPQLRTDENGEILIDFTIPEALTKWRFKAFAHTKDLQTGYLERMIVTQKQLSISANMPRFLREGDSITLSARLVNLTTAPLKGKVQIQLFNALNMQPVSLLINTKDAMQNFDLAASTNKAISFRLLIPAGLEALTYKLTADAGQFTDGEENTLPVLPNRMLVTESMPMMVRAGQERSFIFDKLVNQNSNTLKSKTLTLEYTQNPVWYAIQAMPYMMEFPYECSEQIFSRFYANSIATSLVNKFPVIKQVFDQWKNTNSPQLLSNLEKNQELKATLLEETPWLQDAMNESEQKKRIALLFDLNKMSYELKQNLDKLEKKQLPGGAFPWFGGEYPDRYITQHILEGIGQLTHLNVADAGNQTLKTITDKALSYLDKALIEDAYKQKEYKTYESRNVSSMEIHSWFTKSYFTSRKESADLQPMLTNYLQLAEKQWLGLNIYEQAMIALTMQRNNKPEVAQMIIRSLNETAQHSDDLGMYWAKNQLGYYWYQSPVETQSLMIELFTEAGNDPKAVEEMKIWLLRNKQTSNWKTTKATSAACYALLMKGENWLESSGPSIIKLGGKSLEELKPDVKADVGTGYIKTAWTDEQVKPSFGKVAIQNNGKTISWGAIHWQYLENLDKITSSKTDIQLERKYFIQKQSDTGPVLTAIDEQHLPHTGDLLKVVVYLKVGRDFEYIQLKDMRPSGTEPVDVISSFKFQDGLYYYQVTKDVATNFFISNLAKGSYVFEYRLRVVQPGNFSTGITSVQSMYAPEFNSHSEGARMLIRPN